MNIYVKQFGKLILGIAVVVISLFPLLMGSYFFFLGCDYQAWGEVFLTDGVPANEPLVTAIIGLVTAVFLGICVWGFMWMLSSTRYSDKDMLKYIEKAVKKDKAEREAQCTHDTFHQVGFTNLLSCDECGATFVNPHFIEASK